jgi:hypothetical protein
LLYQLSYPGEVSPLIIHKIPENPRDILFKKTGAKGFEPSTSGVTGQHPKPLDHAPMLLASVKGAILYAEEAFVFKFSV